MIIFRERLKEARKKRGYTQEDVGKGIYISKNEICAYECGTRCPPLETLMRLAEFLQVDFLWLIGKELNCIVGPDKLINLSESDLKILNLIRENEKVYKQFLENPERTIKSIESNL